MPRWNRSDPSRATDIGRSSAGHSPGVRTFAGLGRRARGPTIGAEEPSLTSELTPSAPRRRTPSLRLVARTVPVPALSGEEREELWGIFSRYYADVSRDRFERDLACKQEVVLLRDSGDRSLQGFSTLEVYRRRHRGRRFVAVYSGDTIIEEPYWGQTALQRAFFRFLLATKLRQPHLPVYWFLISKGYKTYLLLARNVPHHWPRHDRPTPTAEQAVLDDLARDKFGAAYDAATGVLRFEVCQGRLKDGVAPIEAGLLAEPEIRFFVTRNPGHARGEELCCLGAVDLALPAHFMARQAHKALRGWRQRARKLWATAGASS
jgi:hypothetical protein